MFLLCNPRHIPSPGRGNTHTHSESDRCAADGGCSDVQTRIYDGDGEEEDDGDVDDGIDSYGTPSTDLLPIREPILADPSVEGPDGSPASPESSSQLLGVFFICVRFSLYSPLSRSLSVSLPRSLVTPARSLDPAALCRRAALIARISLSLAAATMNNEVSHLIVSLPREKGKNEILY